MLTAKQIDDLIAEWRLLSVRKKSELLAEFLKEYGEQAEWEEWLSYLRERAEMDKFAWARSFESRNRDSS